MSRRVAGTMISVAWLSVVYGAVATYVGLFRDDAPGWIPIVALPVVLLGILFGACGAFLAPPDLSGRGAWASTVGSGLFVSALLLLALVLLSIAWP